MSFFYLITLIIRIYTYFIFPNIIIHTFYTPFIFLQSIDILIHFFINNVEYIITFNQNEQLF